MAQPSLRKITMTSAPTMQFEFRNRFGQSAHVYRAPGRVNLIGEHTDYNDGFVMPVAIDLFTWVAIAPREDRRIRVYSSNFSETREMSLDEVPVRAGEWSDYIFGVAVTLERSGYRLPGADLLITGEVPIGAGLSSSAAIEVASAYSLLHNAGHSFNDEQLALMCQQGENEFVGARCGIMDQFIATFGKPEKAVMLDCRSLEYELLPIPNDVRIVICNTMVRHELADSEYNARRLECESAVRILAKIRPGIRALRDIMVCELNQYRSELSERVYRRCLHVVTENQRVQEAAHALRLGDFEHLGKLMGESHKSLRDHYEVSCSELDLMVELAGQVRGVYGARMTGAGFGGCTVNLVRSEAVVPFVSYIQEDYAQLTLQIPEIHVCSAAPGVQEVRLE
jgi:galactokinase